LLLSLPQEPQQELDPQVEQDPQELVPLEAPVSGKARASLVVITSSPSMPTEPTSMSSNLISSIILVSYLG